MKAKPLRGLGLLLWPVPDEGGSFAVFTGEPGSVGEEPATDRRSRRTGNRALSRSSFPCRAELDRAEGGRTGDAVVRLLVAGLVDRAELHVAAWKVSVVISPV